MRRIADRTVVDTNVLIVANGLATHAAMDCQLSCVGELARLQREGVVCVDNKRLIMGEYGRMTDHDGPPMPGSAFYKYLWQNMYNEEKVRQVQVEPRDSEGRDFDDPVLPPNNLKKDAKFLAVAVKAEAVVVNAVDSDWYEHRALTDDLGVRVRQLCPQHSTRRRATPRADDASR